MIMNINCCVVNKGVFYVSSYAADVLDALSLAPVLRK